MIPATWEVEEKFARFAAIAQFSNSRNVVRGQLGPHERFGGDFPTGPARHKPDEQFRIRESRGDSGPTESFSQFGDDLADGRHGYSDSALSWASSST